MATQETKILDSIIASRRALLMGGGSLAAIALVGGHKAMAQSAAIADSDVLNFALNLEYLEAQFYTIATEGVTADQSANGKITLPSGSGAVAFAPGSKVTFNSPFVKAFAFEIASHERTHVTFLQNALGTAKVAQPALDFVGSTAALGQAIGVPTFNPFLNDLQFLLGAFIFEDVGVTAYHGGAGLITNKNPSTTDNLTPAAKIHATEAYHAGIIRTSIYAVDQGYLPLGSGQGVGQAAALATKIAGVRATFDGTAGTTGLTDYGTTYNQVTLNGTTVQQTMVTDAPPNFLPPARTPAQVLRVVYADQTGTKHTGGFFPAGLNGNVK